MAKRQFDRPAPGKYYTEAQRKAWGAAQDIARAQRNSQSEKPVVAKQRASRAKTLVADVSNSSCFDSLIYRNGVVTATFANPTQGDWDYEMSLSEARQWFSADSLGGYFNDEVREPSVQGN